MSNEQVPSEVQMGDGLDQKVGREIESGDKNPDSEGVIVEPEIVVEGDEDKKVVVQRRGGGFRKAIALGATIAAGYAGINDAEAAGRKNKKPIPQGVRAERVVQSEKINAMYITNFTIRLQQEAGKVATSTSEREYKDFVRKIEDFYTKIDFATTLTSEDKDAVKESAVVIRDLLLKISPYMLKAAEKTDQNTARLKEIPNDGQVAYGANLAEMRQLRINQDERVAQGLRQLYQDALVLAEKFGELAE